MTAEELVIAETETAVQNEMNNPAGNLGVLFADIVTNNGFASIGNDLIDALDNHEPFTDFIDFMKWLWEKVAEFARWLWDKLFG